MAQVYDKTTHQRTVRTVLDEKELERIVIQHLADQAHITLTDDMVRQVIFRRVDRPGTAGTMEQAEVTLTINLDPKEP